MVIVPHKSLSPTEYAMRVHGCCVIRLGTSRLLSRCVVKVAKPAAAKKCKKEFGEQMRDERE